MNAYGTKVLRLEVSDSSGKGPFVAEETVEVVPENFDLSWWNWDIRGTQPIHDKTQNTGWFYNATMGQPYQVAGTFTNHSQWSGRHGGLRLLELHSYDFDGPPTSFFEPPIATERASTIIDLPPGGMAQLGSPTIVISWSWISLSDGGLGGGSTTLPWFSDPTSFGPNPPVYGLDWRRPFRVYNYVILASLEDDYGNQYQEAINPATHEALTDWLKSQPAVTVAVYVPVSKLQLAATADNLLAYAQWFMYFSWLIPAADRIAEHLTQLAEGYVLAANDPPTPDPQYSEPITIRVDKTPEFLAGHAQLSILDEGIGLYSRVLEAWQAQNMIQGRLEGARRANDPSALQLQAQSYIQAVNHLVDSTSRLLHLTPRMVDVIENNKQIDWQAVLGVVECWLVEGIPEDIVNRWQDQSLSMARLRQLESAVKTPAIARRSPFVGSVLASAAQAVARLAYDIREETPKVLRPYLKSSEH